MAGMDFPSSPTNGQQTTDGRYYFDSSVGSTGAWRSTPLPIGGLPAGSIMQWATPTLPANWLLCDGSAVSRSVYSSLFAVVGTTYGPGDGSTTFNLPDIPNGDAAGIIGITRINSQITVTTTPADLTGASVTVNFRAGRTYRLTFESPNLNGSASGRVRLNFYVNGAEIDRQYVGLIAGSGGNAINVSTYYTPTVDGSVVVKMNGFIDAGSPTTLTIYADAASTTVLSVEDIGEAPGSTLRQRAIIKASAGWTAGDSELATRIGVLEQNPNITGTLTVAGTTTLNGYLKTPNRPAFVASSSGGTFSVGSGIVFPFNVTSINVGNGFNTSTSRFTAPVAGTYLFATSIYTNTASQTWPTFYKNGSPFAVSDHVTAYNGGGTAGVALSTLISLAANDYVQVFQRAVGQTSATYGGHNYFSGYLIG